ncbi:MAG: preprotein translocase subunit YajC [Micrococcales bacterium]|nr:preprotein translocase subunit YajC [Micrococcales bacterium]
MITGLVQAADDGGGGGGMGGMTLLFLGLFAFIGLTWFLNNRKSRAQADLRSSLAPGDEVMTASGLFATVVRADGDVLVLETSPGVEQRWARAAIMRKVPPVLPEVEQENADDSIQDAIDDPDFDEFEVPDDASSLDPDPDDSKS